MTLPGQRKLAFVGSYRLTGRRLGKGNFAKVEEAVHSVLKCKVALKVMNTSEIKEDYVIRNLHREARLMSQLNHPCIATLYETMQNGPVYYLVTELVGGGDLSTFIKSQRNGKLEERSSKIFGRQLVSAVAYMHGLGIVHRDLKMENIMLTDNKTHLKIVDFGLSNSWSTDRLLRTHCGSPEYAAPELFITGQLYGPQVDLWSLGVILYGMVLGQLPFVTSRDIRISSQERRKHLLQQINRGLAPAHRKALAPFSIEFRALLARLLTPDPAKRIRISELARYTWFTDRNRKPLRITGQGDIEPTWKQLLLKEVGKLLHMEHSHVISAVRSEPYGAIGGVYNILASKRSQQLEIGNLNGLVGQYARPISCGTASQHMPRFQIPDRPVTACTCARHNPATSGHRNTTRGNTAWKNEVQTTPSRLRVIGTRNIKSHSMHKASSKGNIHNSSRMQSAKHPVESLVNRRSKSEPLPHPQSNALRASRNSSSASSATPPGGHTAERAQKRKSEQHQLQRRGTRPGTSGSSGRKSCPTSTPNNGSTRSTNTHPHSAGSNLRTRLSLQAAEARSMPNSAAQSVDPKINQRLLNEPIARCIAGYVGKYMNAHGAKMDKRFCIIQPSRDNNYHPNQISTIGHHPRREGMKYD